MSSILLTGPALEPLALAEAKAFLRVDISDDDDLITALITAARSAVEARTRRALITQTWRLVRDAWPDDGRIRVTPAPLQALVAARVYDVDGTAQAIDSEAFVADTAGSELSFMAWSLPAPGREAAGIELDLRVGYGDAAANVPEPLRLAMRLLIAHWYENRGVVALNVTAAQLPAGVAALIAPYRVLAL